MRLAALLALRPGRCGDAAPARRWPDPGPSIGRRLLVLGEGSGRRQRRLDFSLLALALTRFAVAADPHFQIRRGCRPRRALALALAQRIHDPEIMLGVLIEVFRRHPVAARLRLPRQRDVTLEYLIRVAAYFDARPVAVERLDAMRQARPVRSE